MIDKFRTHETLARLGVAVPGHHLVRATDTDLSAVRYPAFVKPMGESRSVGVTDDSVVLSEAELRRQVAYVDREFHQPALVEDFLPGDEDRAFRRTLIRISRPFRAPGGAGRAWEAYLAHYGQDGFTAEVTGILDRMRSEPQKGAAMFRNRITTMQHAELWRETLTRMMAGAARRPSRAAGEVVREWFERAEVSASEGRSGDRRPR
jgi:hypothetical protein